MARFNLDKGERFSLKKSEGLRYLRVELTWDSDADLDAEAFCLTDNGLIDADADFIYYNSNTRTAPLQEGESATDYFNRVEEIPYERKFGSKNNWRGKTVPFSTDGSVIGSWDDPGSEEEEEENGETIRVNLERVRPGITEIVFCATIHHPDDANFSFRNVPGAAITIFNAENDEELCRYEIDQKFSSEDALVAGRVMLTENGDWEFEAAGDAYDGGLQTLVDLFT